MNWSMWWKLPGPARFLRALARNIEDGKNIVLRWPNRAPKDWRRALEEAEPWLRTSFIWTPLPASKINERSPQEFLANSTGLNLGKPWEITPESLVEEHHKIASRIFFIDGLNATTWAGWKPFLTRYADLSRTIDTDLRPRFIVSLAGSAALDIPSTDICLTSLAWDGYVSSLDAKVFASHLWHDSLCRARQRPLWLAMIAAFAAWDPAAIQTLAQMKLANLCDHQTLSERLGELFFANPQPAVSDSPETDRDHLWLQGLLQHFDGRDSHHPALRLADPDALTYLLWSAQIAVLLPLIEEERRRFLDKFATTFQVPFTTPTGEHIERVDRMEIGHIWHQMSKNAARYPTTDLDRIRLLRRARNTLAHFQPLDFNTIHLCLA